MITAYVLCPGSRYVQSDFPVIAMLMPIKQNTDYTTLSVPLEQIKRFTVSIASGT